MKTKLLIVAATALLILPGTTFAQDAPAGPAAGKHRFNPEERLKMMTEKLGLSDDQQAKIKEIYKSHAPAFKELLSKGRENLTDADKAQLHTMMQEVHAAVLEVLTPEQKEKLEKARAAHGFGGPGGRAGDRKPEAQ